MLEQAIRAACQVVKADSRWDLLEAARAKLLGKFATRGVIKIEFTAAFPHLDRIGVWLCTATDEQRDAPGTVDPCLAEIRRILVGVGFTAEQMGEVVATSQSRETVDRDYQGSWFYAMR